MRAVVALLLLLASACDSHVPAPLAPPKPEVQVEESWGIMSVVGERAVRVGYVHGTRTCRPDEVETQVKSRMVLKRMGTGIEVTTDTRHVETPDGRPLRFTSRMVMSSSPTVNEGVIKDGRLKLSTTTGGATRESEIAWDPEWILSEGMRLATLKKGFAKGTAYTLKSFNAELGKPDEISILVEGREKKTFQGREQELVRVLTKTSLQPGIAITSWMDDKASSVAMETNMMGIKIVMEPATREEALRNTGAEMPEVFFGTMPRSNVALPRPREITALTVQMTRPDEVFAEWKAPAGTQSVVNRSARSVTLRVESSQPTTGTPGPDLAIFLKPSPAVQCDDAEIAAEARKIAGDEKDPALVAGRLAAWVHNHIDKKSMDIGAASAREVYTNRTGDCTEHAVLLAAMFRAAGIPAKVCCGYLYYRGAWGGHAWTSAWLGRWVDFDATLGGSVADAARIKFSETDAEDSGSTLEGMRGAGFMHGAMKIEILDYTIEGRATKVAPPPAAEGNRFEAPLLGVAFEKPEGWTFRDAKDLPPFTLAVIGSADPDNRAIVSYIDLPYELVKLDTRKAARKLGASSSGELGTLEGRETYETDSRWYVRLGPGEVLEVVLKGDEDACRPALERMKKTLKITR